MSDVAPWQRFRSGYPCPVCHGQMNMMKGTGKRCWGFISADGMKACCTREVKAGGIPEIEGVGYWHSLNALCQCGEQHVAPDLVTWSR